MRLWPALDIHRPSGLGDLEELQGTILAVLDDAGVTAVQELSFGWRVFFATTTARDKAAAVLRSWDPALPVAPVDVSDEDWARRSQDGLGPVRVGRVRILPSLAAGATREGENVPEPPGVDVGIIIQPSMGFGTGHHATTRLCVGLLQQTDLVGRRVLDVGTGSGVLAIVAWRLGAGVVLGVDDDGDALQSARENLDLNRITGGVTLRKADFRELAAGTFDIVTANLTGGLLVRGADALLAAVAPAGRLILSGITADEEATVRGFFEPRLPLLAREEEDGWVGLLLGR
jgi:ribosomal protein L11 methyltransferase